MENFISGKQAILLTYGISILTLRSAAGYPGCEFQIRAELANVVGKEKSELFFDKVRFTVRPSSISETKLANDLLG